MDKKNQKILVIAALISVSAIIIFGVMIVQKLERVVQVAERTEQKIDNAIEVIAPVGRAAADKGVSVINNVNEEELARSAEEGVKEVGAVAKDKLLKWIDAQKASSTNQEIPNLKITIKKKATE
jgi:hypothetical protein